MAGCIEMLCSRERWWCFDSGWQQWSGEKCLNYWHALKLGPAGFTNGCDVGWGVKTPRWGLDLWPEKRESRSHTIWINPVSWSSKAESWARDTKLEVISVRIVFMPRHQVRSLHELRQRREQSQGLSPGPAWEFEVNEKKLRRVGRNCARGKKTFQNIVSFRMQVRKPQNENEQAALSGPGKPVLAFNVNYYI